MAPQLVQKHNRHAAGFTLVELLVVVGIMGILITITAVAINFNYSAEKVRAGARQVQSFIMGARDRAIYAKEARGVRLILSPNDSHTVVAIQYVGSGDRLSQGKVKFFSNTAQYPTGKADLVEIPNARILEQNGMLGIGSLIEIPIGSGAYFAVSSKTFAVTDDFGSVHYVVLLNKDCPSFGGPGSATDYALILQPSLLIGSEPVQLPAGVAIDLDGSQLPATWRPSSSNTNASYSTTMDIMFNPRGNVIGDAATAGIVHLLLADTGDIAKWSGIQGRMRMVSPSTTQWNPPAVPVNQAAGAPMVLRDQIVVSLNGRTGNTTVHRINSTPNTVNTAVADDPYSYAETGQVTNQ